MNYYTLILTVAACMASCSAKPSGLLPASLVAAPLAYPAPLLASRSAQVVQNFHPLTVPYFASPVLSARYAYAAPVAARYAFPAAAPLVAAPARFATPAVAAPLVAAPPALAAPAVAPALPVPYPYYV